MKKLLAFKLYTARDFLPFDLLLESTDLPAFVDILSLNPWVLFRLIFVTFSVLFIFIHSFLTKKQCIYYMF